MKQEKSREECPPCPRNDEFRIHGLIEAMLLLKIGELPRHGYELYKALSSELPENLIPDVAVIYRILRKLKTETYAVSRFMPGEGGPARKVYSLTQNGAAYLAQRYESVQLRVKALTSFLEEYEKHGDYLRVEEEEG